MSYRRCTAITLQNVQCKKETKGEYCYMHKSPISDTLKQMYIEARKRSERFIKYALREYRKNCIRHQKYMQSNICRAVTKKKYICGAVTKFTYCNVHKHLDTTRETVQEKIPVVEKKDVDAIIKELRSRRYEERKYHGYVTSILKINRIKDDYELEWRRINKYYKDCAIMAGALTDKELDTYYEKIDAKVKEIQDFTDGKVRLIEEEEDDTSELGLILAQIEKEKNMIKRRHYKGPSVHPFAMQKIESMYDYEVQQKIDAYNGIAQSLSYADPVEEYEYIQEMKLESKKAIKAIEKDIDATVKALIPNKKSHSKYY